MLLFDTQVEIKENKNCYLLEDEMILLGRKSSADIPLKLSYISREQATIVRFSKPDSDRFQYHIFDGGKRGRSTNGIRVNGRRTLSSQLKHGDLVNLGKDFTFIYINLALSDVELPKYIELVSRQSKIDVASESVANAAAKQLRETLNASLKIDTVSSTEVLH